MRGDGEGGSWGEGGGVKKRVKKKKKKKKKKGRILEIVKTRVCPTGSGEVCGDEKLMRPSS